jgi:tRNA threonylcarbamoyladenosine biosynthesis protein TsaB
MSHPPQLLCIDCSTLPASVALVGRDGIVGQLAQHDEQRTDAWVGLAVERCLDGAGTDVDGIDGIVACVGPGTFTGIRVGIATALGLAAPGALPVAGVTSLDALALIGSRRARLVAACIDARRGQVYGALYAGITDADEPPLEPLWGPAACAPADLETVLLRQTEAPLVIGSGAAVLRASDGPLARRTDARGAAAILAEEPQPLAVAAGELALRRWPIDGEAPVDWPPPEPVYLRPPDATPPRNPLLRAQR